MSENKYHIKIKSLKKWVFVSKSLLLIYLTKKKKNIYIYIENKTISSCCEFSSKISLIHGYMTPKKQ